MTRHFSRRQFLKTAAAAGAGASLPFVPSFGQQAPAANSVQVTPLPPAPAAIAAPPGFGVAKGPFQPTWDSLATFQVPEWYRDAKFGIWAHWGPDRKSVV